MNLQVILAALSDYLLTTPLRVLVHVSRFTDIQEIEIEGDDV